MCGAGGRLCTLKAVFFAPLFGGLPFLEGSGEVVVVSGRKVLSLFTCQELDLPPAQIFSSSPPSFSEDHSERQELVALVQI